MAGFHICAVTFVFYTQCDTNSWTSSMHFRQFSKMGFVDDKRIAIWGWVSTLADVFLTECNPKQDNLLLFVRIWRCKSQPSCPSKKVQMS